MTATHYYATTARCASATFAGEFLSNANVPYMRSSFRIMTHPVLIIFSTLKGLSDSVWHSSITTYTLMCKHTTDLPLLCADSA